MSQIIGTQKFDKSVNGQKFFNTEISIAPIRIFLHQSGENISEYLICSDPLYSEHNDNKGDPSFFENLELIASTEDIDDYKSYQ